MAEQVHDRLEELLPVFEELNRVGLFSEKEVKNLIRKCTAHEYKIARMHKSKNDYILYSQFNINLLELIKKRRKKLMYYFKKDQIEYLLIARIHSLLSASCFRWPADIKLWLSHIKFCEQWNKRYQLSKIWSTILKYHANKEYVWVMAAQFEVKDGNFDNARNLFFQALRHHPKNKRIWLQYFRMEVISLTKMNHRLNTITGPEIDGKVNIEDSETDDAILKGAIAKLVYQNAKSVFPQDSKFCCEFLNLSLEFMPFATNLVQDIINDIATSFCTDATARSKLAMVHMHPIYYNKEDLSFNLAELEDACFKSFDEALTDVNNNEIYDKYIDFIFSRMTSNLQSVSSDILKFDTVDPQKYHQLINKVCAQALIRNKLSLKSSIRYAEFLLETGGTGKALRLLQNMNNTIDSSDIKLKILELKIASMENHDVAEILLEIETIANKNKQVIDEEKYYNLWFQICIYTGTEDSFKKLIFTAIKNKSVLVAKMKCDFLSWAACNLSYKKCQKLFRQFLLKEGIVTKELFLEMILLSENYGENCNKLSSIMKYYDLALDKFGSSEIEIWLSYIKFATKHFPMKVSDIHWKAKHSLNPGALELFFEKLSALKINEFV